MTTKKRTSWIVAAVCVASLVGGAAAVRFLSFQKEPARQPSPSRPPISSTRPEPSPAAIPTTASSKTGAPLYFTTMTHMEEDFKDDKDKGLFDRHVANMRWAMDLFDEYGAKLTFESDQPFAKANTVWGVNVLKEAVDRGHGVGTHAGFGATKGVTLTVDQLAAKFKENKDLIDGLVGASNNRGVSGGTGPTDWVLGASAAGFDFIDAVTGFGYLSMPVSARPDGWTNQYVMKTAYHDSIPPEFADRLYPLSLSDAKDLVPDANGVLTMMGGDIGELSSLGDGRNNCFPNCVLDLADVTAVTDAIAEADSIRDRSRVARVNMHIPMILLDKKNETLLRQMLAGIKAYADKGTVAWATQLGSYEGYRSW